MSTTNPHQGGDPFVTSGPPSRHHPLRLASDRYSPDTTLVEAAVDKLSRCHAGLGLSPERARAAADLLTEVWGPRGRLPIGRPRWRCYVSIDGSPFELSASWRGTDVEVRITVEALADPPEPAANQDFAWDYLRGLAGRPGVDVGRVLALEDLFRSPAPREHYWMMHGVAWRSDAEPLFKVYLDPHVNGSEHAPAIIDEAMARLGLSNAWQATLAHAAPLGGPGRIGALALDLTDPARARAKVYLQYADLDAATIDRQAEIAPSHVPGAFEAALGTILGHTRPPFAKPPVTCFAFRQGMPAPTAATLYVPMIPEFVEDAAARDRTAAFLDGVGIDPIPYVSFLSSIADRPLHETGNQNFIAYEPAPPGGTARFSGYAAPGLYS
ncbi:tryptophan dimethylallyltransferase family protein [Nocardiopsis ansamitocini]|uniref:tryptophan dimethylallyltransferase family protein n=1 Tax=Nocardiopsis ansamitocini TaxID=1670832 RepID=UPI0025561314|nr:tryptophan dimethylallyltransferase family protein [Nocardiopsis ansamitocini]